jgi:hypothetical protein
LRLEQLLQQAELLAPEIERVSGPAHHAFGRIQRHIPNSQHWRRDG